MTDWLLSLVALVPLVLVLLTMMRLRWSSARAGALGWAAALLLAATIFRAPPTLLWYAHLRSLFLSLYVLYIIWTALLLYHVIAEAGAIQDIGRGISRLTGEPLTQLLILAWVFASFLQGIAGFGVPVAVVTPLLIGLGFEPMLALVATGIAHGWAVTFGSAGSSFYTMVAVTDLPGEALAPAAALLLGAMAWFCGGSVAHLFGGWAAVARGALLIALAGLAMAGVQYALAAAGFWAIAAFGGGLVGMLAVVPLARLPRYRGAPTGRQP
ncbi:MAG: L-lactate permease, partial [Candidatus Acidiferrales bacterium]